MQVSESRTEDEVEVCFAIIYLGHFLLTHLLLDSLVHSGKDGSCSRVIRICAAFSSSHEAYAWSKLAQLLFTSDLHRAPEPSGSAVTSTRAWWTRDCTAASPDSHTDLSPGSSSRLQLKVPLLLFLQNWKELVDVSCLKVIRFSPQQLLSIKIFRLDSRERPAICCASGTRCFSHMTQCGRFTFVNWFN